MFIYFKKCSAFLPSLFYFVSQEEQTFTFIFFGLFIVDLPIYVLPNPSETSPGSRSHYNGTQSSGS